MNEMKVFENSEFGCLEVLWEGEKAYFPAIDCAKILGYTNPRKAIRDHCKGERVVPSLQMAVFRRKSTFQRATFTA